MKGISTVIISLLISFSVNAASSHKTICGKTDDRSISSDPKVGRLMRNLAPRGSICTLTMISKTCAITAGHCEGAFNHVQFNTPLSSEAGEVMLSETKDTYQIDRSKSDLRYRFKRDWGVVKVKKNSETEAFAGDVQGFYKVNTEDRPSKEDNIMITGYGSNGVKNERHYAQKEDSGTIERVTSKYIYHNADTTGGNSGSSIINEATSEIVGIHTNGGCLEEGGANKGTLIYGNRALIRAINKCLASE